MVTTMLQPRNNTCDRLIGNEFSEVDPHIHYIMIILCTHDYYSFNNAYS